LLIYSKGRLIHTVVPLACSGEDKRSRDGGEQADHQRLPDVGRARLDAELGGGDGNASLARHDCEAEKEKLGGGVEVVDGLPENFVRESSEGEEKL